jgi:hypothetical protein
MLQNVETAEASGQQATDVGFEPNQVLPEIRYVYGIAANGPYLCLTVAV